ncbi:uncharacterized protein VTP21DRAFT_2217 [Calcarisporiella thermophila]|uniref:uncharacterized protein n=1 Tax=Calcarisporiella thermophila TaxID=911321 RepID=UPI003743C30F
MRSLLALLALSIAALSVEAGDTAKVESSANFCFFLPPKPGGGIAEHEDDAIAFCTKKSLAPGANEFPPGFILSAHFKQEKNYVQVTGRINPDKYKLSRRDEGGQYDTKAPIGAKCAGFSSFVNLVEPNDGNYCIRCCKDPKDCDTRHSENGCRDVIPGDYS